MTPLQAERKGQFYLLRERRFLPFFCTQFMGAFNDNLYKTALLLLIAYQSAALTTIDTDILNNLAAGLFILPFFLFSSLAGQLADKFEKGRLIRLLKCTELAAMCCAAVALYFQSLWGLLLVLFMMGGQSAFFGPVKYSIIPQHLKAHELVAGNAFVEMGTFLAILLGTAAAGVMIQAQTPWLWISTCVCIVALAGCLTSQWIPQAEGVEKSMQVNFNPWVTTLEIIGYARSKRSVFLAIMGISWFWFLGASYLTQLPNYSIEMLCSRESVVTVLLCLFSIGIGVGALLCDRFSGHRVEIGIVPLGSLGLSIFGIDLYFASDLPVVSELRELAVFLATPGALRILIDITAIGIFGGFFIVPLYAMVQQRTPSAQRARVIAANNVFNALFMVMAAVLGMLLLGLAELDKAQYFLVLAIINIAVAWFIYAQVPEFGMRFLVWLLSHSLYRIRHVDLDNIPERGPAVLVCNHVSYVDALILAGAIHRPVRFVMLRSIYDLPLLNYLFRAGGAIPICSRKESEEVYHSAFIKMGQYLEQGELVCIFPEGGLTRNGDIGPFQPGIEKIIKNHPVPVIPLALRGLWGSFFSHHGKAFPRLPGKLLAPVTVIAAQPVTADRVSAQILYEKVSQLRGEIC